MSFINEIKEKAKKEIKNIILTESEDVRVLKAAEQIKNEAFANIILIGNEEEANKLAKIMILIYRVSRLLSLFLLRNMMNMQMLFMS